ncbi:aminoacyl-tRNA hydrolase [Abyssalbus ytuae]|uniref:Peptidyl-tRNA hydrolase n=1 Tax=Abyssalbus ytuae TaxID=2926907 RepID=A0A9E6ZYD1_9FLAO|nr:aminoacyl-tRNA hydrolase [Abyssalbus ytuae]UOB16161.1 aminoacyl-tRNA hydrolase [Abyssalbus ytuae]
MFSLLKKLFYKNQKSEIGATETMKKFLIVGLGNIGTEYKNTRHNIGFKIVDHFAQKESLNFETKRLGDIAIYKFKGRMFIFLKPSTYMNLSGKAVKFWIEKEKVPLENVLIITDDLNLPFGTIRLKGKGSHGGHNGLKDIEDKLTTTNYCRFRFGVGNNFTKGRQIDYVLGEWDETELENMQTLLDKGVELIKSFVFEGLDKTMNFFNKKN